MLPDRTALLKGSKTKLRVLPHRRSKIPEQSRVNDNVRNGYETKPGVLDENKHQGSLGLEASGKKPGSNLGRRGQNVTFKLTEPQMNIVDTMPDIVIEDTSQDIKVSDDIGGVDHRDITIIDADLKAVIGILSSELNSINAVETMLLKQTQKFNT